MTGRQPEVVIQHLPALHLAQPGVHHGRQHRTGRAGLGRSREELQHLVEQAPVLLQVTCPQMVAYRFVREDPPNMLVAARLVNADSARLDWTSWVIIKQNRYPNLPAYVPIPAREELPDSVRQWLDATDCCQVSAPIVQSKADSIRDTTTNLMKVANDVCRFCRRTLVTTVQA